MGSPIIFAGANAKLLNSGTLVDKRGIPYIQQPEKNYIRNSSAAVNLDGWVNNAINIDLTQTVTAAELPREFTTGSGIKIVSSDVLVVPSDYIYFDFTLDDVDLNKKLKIQWAQKVVATYASGEFSFYIASQASRGTALHTPETNLIPSYDGVFQTSFDSGSTATLSLVIRLAASTFTGDGIVISDVIVGPGSIQAVPAIGTVPITTQSVLTYAGVASTNATVTSLMDRVGSKANIKIFVNFTAAANASGEMYFTIPNGLTVDATQQTNAYEATGKAWGFFNSKLYSGIVRFQFGSSVVKIIYDLDTGATASGYHWTGHTTAGSNIPALVAIASGNQISLQLDNVPIAEWAGAPNYAGQNDTTYGSNSGVFGPQGSLVPNVAFSTGVTARTFTVPSTVQATDKAVLEYSIAGRPFQNAADVYPQFKGNNAVATNQYGLQGYWSSATGYTVDFGNQGTQVTASNASNGLSSWATSFTSGDKFRIRFEKAGSAVGFGLATATQSGLVSREYVSAEADLGTISKTGTWTTIDSAKYKWIQVGKKVDIWWRLESTTASSGLSVIVFDLPSDCPAPALFSTVGNNEWMSSGDGGISNTGAGDPATVRVSLYSSTGTRKIYNLMASGTYTHLFGHLTYFTE